MSNTRLAKLKELLKMQPDDPFMLYAVGFEYESADDYAQALGYYEKILSGHKDYLPVYYQSGLLYAQLGKTERALQLLNEGVALARSQQDSKTLRELNAAIAQIEDDLD